ncbi:MAG: lysophospholipid acyltransferase family protein [Leptothrix ochracea]|uniref:lysophospholipid acyltransferase family protein n=1 Tax=Leptothrix ochracea TaxID=735331 RepID=UPI0034E2A1CD
MTTIRALWRLLRCMGHLLGGLWTLRWHFDHLDEATRHALIQAWALRLLSVLGVGHKMVGIWPSEPHLMVINHVSWLDIMAIHAVRPQARFVSKAEVHRWPMMGRLAAGAGTLFIERESRRDALRVVHHMTEALRAGDTVAVFPEGTTSTGHDVLPFHANLLQAAIAAQVPLQPVVLRFSDAQHAVSPAVAYVGDTSLLRSLWWVVSAQGLQVQVEVLPLMACAGLDRRQLAALVAEQIGAKLRA